MKKYYVQSEILAMPAAETRSEMSAGRVARSMLSDKNSVLTAVLHGSERVVKGLNLAGSLTTILLACTRTCLRTVGLVVVEIHIIQVQARTYLHSPVNS